MKKLILSFTLSFIMFCSCTERAVGFYEREDILQKREDSADKAETDKSKNRFMELQMVCLQRGHNFNDTVANVFKKYEPHSYSGTNYYASEGIWAIGSKVPPQRTINKLIDAKDSSYIISVPNPIMKKCFRCGEDISCPQPPVYVKTIWKASK